MGGEDIFRVYVIAAGEEVAASSRAYHMLSTPSVPRQHCHCMRSDDGVSAGSGMGLLPYVEGYRAGFKAASAADGPNGSGYNAAVSVIMNFSATSYWG